MNLEKTGEPVELFFDSDGFFAGHVGYFRWTNGRVNAEISMNVDPGGDPLPGGWVVIYNFQARSEGQGEGSRALRELKNQFGTVGVMDPVDSSLGFWSLMLERGLVDWIEAS